MITGPQCDRRINMIVKGAASKTRKTYLTPGFITGRFTTYYST